ncbi:unnamed protein product, partial [Didymodactylos carnosus]
ISQNEQVKEQIVNDEQGIDLLAKCAYDQKFDEKKVQEPAIRIILTVSFVGVNAIEKIKEIEPLIERVLIATQSIEPRVERSANGVMWNLGKENEFITKKEEESHSKASPSLPPSSEPIKAKIVQADESKAIYQYVN